ncbi:conserved hypothetical protein [Desulfonatronospira thiodismutans ASO3-1]|uniref:Porin domain-containing protein n=1 Tax=Desulfonatronospira thiodismutans ASO3-1 TaxID=555779 RepID=D6STB8_9BACT|nr:outer membrane homotrimeric porin [Desulfonatronospira thiodismutans]EFI33934.1 conserved hypothetical protein [Desulfonatronospira thiodismutans ASO3-1]
MKRLITLAIMVAFILGTVGMAKAIEFQAKGDWQIGINAVSNPTFDSDDDQDEFMATTRVRTTFEFIANENLKGVMRVHSGDRRWGDGGSGSQIGREGAVGNSSFEYDRAYLDFMIPNSPVNMKVGKQPIAFPNTLGSHIFDNSLWAVSASSSVIDMVDVTVGWARIDDTFADGDNKNDEYDLFYGIVPVNMDGFAVNPFVAYGMKGSDHAGATESSGVFWAGLNFTVDMFDPIVVMGDFNYGTHGSTETASGDVGDEARGWIADLAVQYKMDMVTPEVFILYESGESRSSGAIDNRSKIMPSIGGDLFGVSTFAMSGSPLRGIGRATLDGYAGISAWGPSGKMAVGGKLGDMSFLDDVTHDLQLTYYQGTNHKDNEGLFTTRDSAWEVTFDTSYQMYENLAAILELGYLHPSINNSSDRGIEDDAAFKAATGFRYLF